MGSDAYIPSFRTDRMPFLDRDRTQEIADALHADASLHCHKTPDYNNADVTADVTGTSKHCAGALIVLEREERPNQMMRIGERLGFYDRTALHMDSRVPDTLDDWVEMQALPANTAGATSTERDCHATVNIPDDR